MSRAHRTRTAILAVGAGCALLAAGCSSGPPGDLTIAAEKVLVPKVEQIRKVAATGNYVRLEQVVRQLKALVQRELADGQVSQARANAILDAADTLLTDAQPTSSPTPSPTQSSSAPRPTPSATPSPTPSSPPSPAPSTTSSSPSPGTTITIGGTTH